MNSPADKLLRNEYMLRINRVIDYINNHYGEDLSLIKLAEIACLSKFHFHRLFHKHFGETVHDCIRRVRLEHATHLLVADVHASIAEIAEACGFSSSQNFSRAFKERFGFSPTAARKNPDQHQHMISKTESREAGDSDETPLAIEVKELPSCRVAYIRDIGPYRSESNERAKERLLQWAVAKKLVNARIMMGVCWSDPETTPSQECIFDACLTVPENVQDDSEVHIQYLPGGKLAILHCECDWETIPTKRKWLFKEWLPASGFQRDERPFFFIYYNNPHMNRLRLAIVDMCLPVKP
jgi:AraC family transcriptional regulator